MKESRRFKYEEGLKRIEQRATPVTFSKASDGMQTIKLDLKKKSTRGLCLCMLLFCNLFIIPMNLINPPYYEVIPISILIGINMILLVFELIIRFNSKGAIHKYIIDKENNRITKKTKKIGNEIIKSYKFNEITHIGCKRIPSEGSPMYQIYFGIAGEKKVNFFHSFSELNAIEIAKNLSETFETNCIFFKLEFTDYWKEPYIFEAKK